MDSIRVSVDLPVLPKRVGKMASHLDRLAGWMVDARSIRFLGEQHCGVGRRVLVETRFGPQRTVDTAPTRRLSAP